METNLLTGKKGIIFGALDEFHRIESCGQLCQ